MLSYGWCAEETSADSADALSVTNCKVCCVYGVVHTGMPNRFRISLKPIWRVHTEIGLVQTDLDPTHLTM